MCRLQNRDGRSRLGCLYRLIRKHRFLATANFEFVAIGVFEKEGVVTRTVVLANLRPLKIFPASVAHEFRNLIHLFARVRPKRDSRAVGTMVLVLAQTEKFQGPFATASIERINNRRPDFREQTQAAAEFCRRTFPPFPCLSPANRCDQSNAFSFCDSQSRRVEIQSRVSAKVGRTVLCAPIAMTKTDRNYSATKRAKIGFSFCIVASGHNFPVGH